MAVVDVVEGDAAVTVVDAVEDDVVEDVVGDVGVGRNCLTGPGTASRSRTPRPLCC